jgi:chromosome segregation and condensation protein ScpB
MKTARKTRSKTLSVAAIRAMKARDRLRDLKRLARKEVKPEQLQEENAAVRHAAEFRILNLREVASAYRVTNRRRSSQ